MEHLTVPVAEILGRPGEYRDFVINEPLAGVHTALARLEGSPVQAGLRAESVVEGILVTGTVEGRASLECARCLRRFASDVTLEVCELYAAPGHEIADDEDAYELRGTDVPLEPMLRDTMTLALPLNPLCGPSCKGICSRCGADLNQGACSCRDEDVDPRWAALSSLKDRLADQ